MIFAFDTTYNYRTLKHHNIVYNIFQLQQLLLSVCVIYTHTPKMLLELGKQDEKNVTFVSYGARKKILFSSIIKADTSN